MFITKCKLREEHIFVRSFKPLRKVEELKNVLRQKIVPISKRKFFFMKIRLILLTEVNEYNLHIFIYSSNSLINNALAQNLIALIKTTAV